MANLQQWQDRPVLCVQHPICISPAPPQTLSQMGWLHIEICIPAEEKEQNIIHCPQITLHD